jgi:hypothetical protein
MNPRDKTRHLIKNLCWLLLFFLLLIPIDLVLMGPGGAELTFFILCPLYLFVRSAKYRMLIRLALAASLLRLVFTAVFLYIACQHTRLLSSKIVCAAAVLAVTPDQLEAQIMSKVKKARKALGPQAGGIDPFTGDALRTDSAGDPYSVGPDCTDDSGCVTYDPTNGTLSRGDITLLTKLS